MLTKVLQEFGSPEAISREFLKDDYIIGPQLMPFFRLAASVAFTAAAVVLVVSTAISTLNGTLSGIPDIIVSLLQAVPFIFGLLVFVFYIIQKTVPKLPDTSSLPRFNPLDLPDQDKEKEKPVSIAEQIITIFFTSVLIIILVFFRDLLQIRISAGTACTVYQIFKPGFISIIPLLVFRWSLDILLAVQLLITRTRNYRIRVMEILLSGFDAAIIILFLQKGPDYFFSFDSLAEIWIDIDSILPAIRILFYGILVLILAFTVFDIIKKIYRIVRKPQLNDDIF